MGPLTSTKPLFSCKDATLGTHGSLWADICMPKFLRKIHYRALLRPQNHRFPARIVHWAHMAPYRLTFVCQIPLYTATIEPTYEHKTIVFLQESYMWPTWLPNGRHLWSKLPRMTPHIHTSFIGNVDLGYTRAIRSFISMHTCSQVSLHPGFQVSIHPFH